MSGFYRKFCISYSTLAVPLTNLSRKSTKFTWSEQCEDAFDKLKGLLAHEPVLKAPGFDRPFQLAVDASDVGVGAVLLQEDEAGINNV